MIELLSFLKWNHVIIKLYLLRGLHDIIRIHLRILCKHSKINKKNVSAYPIPDWTKRELNIIFDVRPYLAGSVNRKVAKCLQKLPKNDFTRKGTDFDTFTKIALECSRLGQINCCHRLWKVAQSPINRTIWSHC